MLTCLVDGYYNYSKKKSVPSLFGNMDFEDYIKVDVMFKSSCQLEMRSSASRFFQEPRLTPNLMMDCAQVLNTCYELGLQKDTEIVHCLMYMVGANKQVNDQTKICVETLNKIAKINQVGIQPGFDERLAADCKAFSNECKDPSCIRLNTYDKYDRIKRLRYPENYSDPCTQRTIEKIFYTLQNLPEDLIDGRLKTCPNENSNYPDMYGVVHKENLTRKIDEYFGPNPLDLLLPFYKVSTGFCNKQIYSYPHGAWEASFCPANFTHITLNPYLQRKELKLNGKNFDKYKPSYKVKNGIVQPYFTINHINGSICKANGLPRTTKVLHFCSPNSYYNLNTIRNHYDYYKMVNEPCETSPCNYEIEVYTYHLCKHPAFLPYLLKTTPSTPIPSTPRPTLEIYEKEKEITWKRNPFTDTPKKTTGLPYWASTPEPVYYRSEFKIPPWVGYFVFGVVMCGALLGFAIRKYMSRNKDRVLWPRAEGYNEVITT
uniref:MRH domain-containing protein n=1 Tax=Acrobeloides nanus TaxID=290746 RepID=A0A914DXD7_9BILA